VVSLAPETASYPYVTALSENVPWLHTSFHIPDRKVPSDPAKFIELARDIARALQEGERVLIHRGAGIGRTGVLAVAVGMACGPPLIEATRRVQLKGSGPENEEQKAFLRTVSRELP
jgi:protein-tyrosine phosphatase